MQRLLTCLTIGLAFAVSSTASAMSCGATISIANHTAGQVSVLMKSFYGVRLQRPSRFDFSDETAVPLAEGSPFTRMYEVVVQPHAIANVGVRTLCGGVADRSHYVNWSYSEEAGLASGQLDLLNENAHINIP